MTVIISIGIMSIIPLLLITVFNRIDDSMDIALKKKDVGIIIAVAVAIPVLRYVIYKSVGADIGIMATLHMDILAAYLIFMSYTDQKTKLLYTSVSLVMLVIELVSGVININFIMGYSNELTWTIGLVPVILFIVSLFNGIGLGDVYIYLVLCLYTLQISHVPTLVMIINILLTNIMFVVTTIFLRVMRKNKEKHLPLTIYITIASIICNTVFINF